MNQDITQSMLEIVRACDSVHLGTCDDAYPDIRHLTNAMNHNVDDLNLHFMTSQRTPKAAQLMQNSNCCLYYFNPGNRHALRLYGKIEFITDMATRRKFWRVEYTKFGYRGPDDNDFILMQFIPEKYKFYVGDKINTGTIN